MERVGISNSPIDRVRDTLRFLKEALTGEKITVENESFNVKGFRLGRVPSITPPIYLGALRPGMLRLAGREADGAIVNWLGAEDVPKAVAEVGPGKEIAARIFVLPSEDADLARTVGRRMITAYLNVEAYAEFHRWLGKRSASAGYVGRLGQRRPQRRSGGHTGPGGRRSGAARLHG